MLRFLYTTDLHGDPRAYARLPDLAAEHGADRIINGGDMLPKGRDIHAAQAAFLGEDLPRFLDLCHARGLTFHGLFGNDDLQAFHDDWLALVARSPAARELTLDWDDLPGGLRIRGASFVPDYPFGLKDWCLRDDPDAAPVPTKRPVVTTRDGAELIADPAAFFAARPTLEEHLDSLADPAAPLDLAIVVCHAPPAGLGLATLWNGHDVGSRSVRRWIERRQPRLVLSGHIHEGPDAELLNRGESRCTAMLGRTTCHQPGQDLPDRLTYSIIDVPDEGPIAVDWRRTGLRL